MLSQVDLNKLVDFVRIVEFGNITRASRGLQIPKAKLSRHLALLEQELEVQLVYRTTRQFQLTDAGRELFQRIKIQFQDMESALAAVSNKKEIVRGRLRITAPEDLGNYLVTPMVTAFKKQYSQIEFELIYTNEILDLVKMGVDVAFRVGNLTDSSMIRRKLGTIEFAMVASKAYLQRTSIPLTLNDLQSHSLIGFSGRDGKKWKLESNQSTEVIKIQPQWTANHFPTIRDLALNDFGIAFLPRFLCENHIRGGDLVPILKEWRYEGAPFQAMIPNQKNPPTHLRKFFDYTVEFATQNFK